MEKRNSAGGKAAAIVIRRQALERYYANPNKCLNCGKIIEVGNKKVSTIRQKKFCNSRCFAIYSNKERNKNHIYKYRCPLCGKILKSKAKYACKDCRHKKAEKHDTRLFSIFKGMRERCYRSNSIAYKNYGGRGIKICDDWKNDFMKFYNWAIENGYKEDLTIERIDVNGNYEPKNCKWISKREQSYNRRINLLIKYNNETHTITEWAEKRGVKRDLLYNRIKRMGIVDKAFENRDLRFRCNP